MTHEEGRAVWATRDRAEAAEAEVVRLKAELAVLRAAEAPPSAEGLDCPDCGALLARAAEAPVAAEGLGVERLRRIDDGAGGLVVGESGPEGLGDLARSVLDHGSPPPGHFAYREPEMTGFEWRAAYFVLARIALKQLDECRAAALAPHELIRTAIARLRHITDYNADVPAAREASWAIGDLEAALRHSDLA